MESWLVPGQKVVCVEDIDAMANEIVFPPLIYPEVDQVYTIRAVRECPCGRCSGFGIAVEEVRNESCTRLGHRPGEGIMLRFGEPYFSSLAFRPLVSKTTSIEVFNEILNSPEVKKAIPVKAPQTPVLEPVDAIGC